MRELGACYGPVQTERKLCIPCKMEKEHHLERASLGCVERLLPAGTFPDP